MCEGSFGIRLLSSVPYPHVLPHPNGKEHGGCGREHIERQHQRCVLCSSFFFTRFAVRTHTMCWPSCGHFNFTEMGNSFIHSFFVLQSSFLFLAFFSPIPCLFTRSQFVYCSCEPQWQRSGTMSIKMAMVISLMATFPLFIYSFFGGKSSVPARKPVLHTIVYRISCRCKS